jgi:FSR family fosmidomycin resistance protein-like MFS transporter
MSKHTQAKSFTRTFQIFWGAFSLTALFLLIEFFDELSYTVDGAALPVIRAELGLSYAQIGLLFGLPAIVGTLVEPVLMLLGDTRLRKRLVLGGGLMMSLALLIVGLAGSFPALVLAFMLAYPASGAFVTLSQATLMDLNPGREAQMMARWTLSGSLGTLVGPLLVAAGFALGLGWRWAFFVLAGLGLALTLLASLQRFPERVSDQPDQGAGLPANATDHESLRSLVAHAWSALRSPQLLRWILLLQMSDLLLDVLAGYAPLYFTDVIGASPTQASLLLTVLMISSLVSDALLIPVLERFPGRLVVRASAAVTFVLYAALLVAPWPAVKIGLMVLVRFSTFGWYSVLQGEAYAALPGKSGTVMAVSSVVGLLGGLIAWLVGWVASLSGLPAAMWLLLAGPLSLALFVPRTPGRRVEMTPDA